jgi:hypothetical protein
MSLITLQRVLMDISPLSMVESNGSRRSKARAKIMATQRFTRLSMQSRWAVEPMNSALHLVNGHIGKAIRSCYNGATENQRLYEDIMAKVRRILLHGSKTTDVKGLASFYEKLTGRKLTAQELKDAEQKLRVALAARDVRRNAR